MSTSAQMNTDKTTDEAAYQAWLDQNRREQCLPAGERARWLLHYADQDVPDEHFDNELFARRRFDQQRCAWSISLFQEVARG